MLSPSANTPRAEDYLPDWAIRRFIMLETSGRWAPVVALQTAQLLKRSATFTGRLPKFETSETARNAAMFCDQDSTVGLILFFENMERDCLSLLGRLARLPLKPPLLAVCQQRHRDLLPILSESGVNTTLFDAVDDNDIAEWCVRVLTRHAELRSDC